MGGNGAMPTPQNQRLVLLPPFLPIQTLKSMMRTLYVIHKGWKGVVVLVDGKLDHDKSGVVKFVWSVSIRGSRASSVRYCTAIRGQRRPENTTTVSPSLLGLLVCGSGLDVVEQCRIGAV